MESQSQTTRKTRAPPKSPWKARVIGSPVVSRSHIPPPSKPKSTFPSPVGCKSQLFQWTKVPKATGLRIPASAKKQEGDDVNFDNSKEKTDTPTEPKTKSPSQILGEWVQLEPLILSAQLAAEAHSNRNFSYSQATQEQAPCPDCGTNLNQTDVNSIRCVDCIHNPVLCQHCAFKRHIHNPLHRVELWLRMDKHFSRVKMSSLGMKLYLGHYGKTCEGFDPQSSGSIIYEISEPEYTIVHTNGIHRMPIHWCTCRGAGTRIEQLISSNLFPGSSDPDHLRTVYTNAALENYNLHSLESNESSGQHMKVLRTLSAGVFRNEVKDRSKEMHMVIRVWRHLESMKESGQEFGIGAHLPSYHASSTAVLCGLCPQPHINMDPDWKSTDPKKSHIHALHISVDATFRLDRRRKAGDPHDFALSNGRSYFVDRGKFEDYLRRTNNDIEPSTCSGFRAGDAIRQGRYQYTDVSGLAASACTRHGCFTPNGMVDLQKGER
ncbi:hypothetical protein FRC03_006839 [Tulasnella sp. 419]|nr:hypothetical protein FRC02_009368 [Tulasnella sp. 418]KAG8960263.1 hypothetical protein FRC03_006839 [Tulasnella sp. 419]